MNSAREYRVLSGSRFSTHNRETAVVREVGETPNDRNDRGNSSFTPRTRHIADSELQPSALGQPGTTRTYPLRVHQSEGSRNQYVPQFYF
jgi:hypothetical protein